MEELLTVNQIVRDFRLSESTVRRWTRSGKLKALRFGGRLLRFKRSEVERLFSDALKVGGVLPGEGA